MDDNSNPSAQLERIRDILIGNQLNEVQDRLNSLENGNSGGASLDEGTLRQTLSGNNAALLEEFESLHHHLQNDAQNQGAQTGFLASKIEEQTRLLQAALERQFDALAQTLSLRFEARLSHGLASLRADLDTWRREIDAKLGAVLDRSVSRTELKDRFARLASAAMEDESPEP